jgi:hypothetical protein
MPARASSCHNLVRGSVPAALIRFLCILVADDFVDVFLLSKDQHLACYLDMGSLTTIKRQAAGPAVELSRTAPTSSGRSPMRR